MKYEVYANGVKELETNSFDAATDKHDELRASGCTEVYIVINTPIHII